MNLTDLQTELRTIEEHLSNLHSEIERMKPKTEEKQKSDFDTITKLAQKQPVKNQTLLSAPEAVRKDFINSLSCLILSEEEERYNRLLYLCRLSMGCGMGQSAEDIYKAGLEFDTSDMDDLCIEMKEYKYIYLVEAFILANLSGKASPEIMLRLADLAALLECDEEEVSVIAQVAKSVLIKNPDVLKDMLMPSTSRLRDKFGEYIPSAWLKSQRIQCLWINKERHKIISKAIDGSLVKKGATILSYKRDARIVGLDFGIVPETKVLSAPCNGVVYMLEDMVYDGQKYDTYITVYVISYFDTYDDLYRWHREKRGNI